MNGTKTAPSFDQLIRVAQSEKVVTDKDCIEKLLLIINKIGVLEIQGEDENRSIWIEMPRGIIEDYGDYEKFLEEDIVSNCEEFVELWENDYPEKSKWYEFSVSTYNKEHYFFVDSVLTFHVKTAEEMPIQAYYNEYRNSHLSFDRRFGKIYRKEYWSIFPEDEILRMITGIDYIGIVPKTILPRYCGSHFPPEEKIIDFMNLGFEKTEELIEKATWYPLREVRVST